MAPFLGSGPYKSFYNTVAALLNQVRYSTRFCAVRLVIHDEFSASPIATDLIQRFLQALPNVSSLVLSNVRIGGTELNTHGPEVLGRLKDLTLKNITCGAEILNILSLFVEIITVEVAACDSLFFEYVQVPSFPEIQRLVIKEETTEYFMRRVFWYLNRTRLTALRSINLPLYTDEGSVEWDNFFAEIGSWVPDVKIRLYDTLLNHLAAGPVEGEATSMSESTTIALYHSHTLTSPFTNSCRRSMAFRT